MSTVKVNLSPEFNKEASTFNQNSIRTYLEEKDVTDKKIVTLVEERSTKVETVVLFDDSSSTTLPMGSPYTQTRWDYIKENIIRDREFISVLDPNGYQLCALNRSILNIAKSNNIATSEENSSGMMTLQNTRQHKDLLNTIFSISPHGSTPIVGTLNQLVQELNPTLKKKQVHALVYTDGLPDGGIKALDTWFKETYIPNPLLVKNFAMSFILCLGNDPHQNNSQDSNSNVIKHYVDIIDPLKKNGKRLMIDVVLPFHLEAKKAQEKNPNIRFGHTEYDLKKFLGAIEAEYDDIGEAQMNNATHLPLGPPESPHKIVANLNHSSPSPSKLQSKPIQISEGSSVTSQILAPTLKRISSSEKLKKDREEAASLDRPPTPPQVETKECCTIS